MEKTTVEKQDDETYLINSDEDSEKDLIYDIGTDTLLEYKSQAKGASELEDNNMTWYITIAIIIIVVVLVVIVIFLKKNYYI